MPQSIDPCEFAYERYQNRAMWRNLWTILLFFFGSMLMLVLCLSVWLMYWQNYVPGFLSSLGTIVNGVGVAWVVSRRKEAVAEDDAAYEDAQRVCGSGGGATPAGAIGIPVVTAPIVIAGSVATRTSPPVIARSVAMRQSDPDSATSHIALDHKSPESQAPIVTAHPSS